MTYPHPKKRIATLEQVRSHIEDLISNVADNYLDIGNGMRIYVLLPGDDAWSDASKEDAGMTVMVQYPYKRCFVSVQQTTIDKMLKHKPSENFWENLERSVFHELLHVVLWDVMAKASMRYISTRDLEDTEESVVDHLTACFIRLLRNYREERDKK